jgi:hypothetical protein
MTDEPGCYFIPALIDQWRKDGTNAQFINFDELEKYKDFGGIRIEDDLLVTATGCKVLGKPIPDMGPGVDYTILFPENGYQLKSLKMSDAVEQIGTGAFRRNSFVEELVLGNKLKKIGSFAFQYMKGVDKNSSLAYKYIKQAAESGNAEAQYQLAMMYLRETELIRAWIMLFIGMERHIRKGIRKAQKHY